MKTKLIKYLNTILHSLEYPEVDIEIQLPKNSAHGDFSTNLAMILAKNIGKNPREIAHTISKSLIASYPKFIEKVDVAGPGFININIYNNMIVSELETVLLKNENFGKSNIGKCKRALVEFVSANPTGPLTVGHGRGAILGDVICNILEWNGYNVEREYYYNNAGMQMKRLGQSVQARYLDLIKKPNTFPEQGYKGEYIIDIAKNLYDSLSDKLDSSNDLKFFTTTAEKYIFENIKKTLKKINLHFDCFFNEQSLYESGAIDKVVNDLKKKDLIFEKDNASWFRFSAIGLTNDRVAIKSSGEPTYRLPDIAYHQNKFDRGYDLMIDVLGADHIDSYPDVLAAIKQMEYDIEKITVLIHQFVTITKDGEPVKMSTRKAEYITLDELIDLVGSDVVRYFFIMRGMNTHLNFDLDLAKDESDENPVYYLQYAHARLCNILKHAKNMNHKLIENANLNLLTLKSEIQLIKNILEFPNIINKGHYSLEPQSIANYLFELASNFHRYYAKERIITKDQEKTDARLILVKALQITIKNGLQILGINAPNKM